MVEWSKQLALPFVCGDPCQSILLGLGLLGFETTFPVGSEVGSFGALSFSGGVWHGFVIFVADGCSRNNKERVILCWMAVQCCILDDVGRLVAELIKREHLPLCLYVPVLLLRSLVVYYFGAAPFFGVTTSKDSGAEEGFTLDSLLLPPVFGHPFWR